MEYLYLFENMDDEQKMCMQSMINGQNIFITGGGGVGKSYLIKMFIKMFFSDKIIGVTSTTGTSALLINGTTVHSYLGIGLGTDDIKTLYEKIKKKRFYLSRWKKLDTLIVDEISMMSPDLFDKLENLARVIRDNDEPFGGIQMIITGDFLQLPCIDNNKFCFEASSWKTVVKKIVYLRKIYRQEDEKFQNCLNNIRIGVINNEVKSILNSRLNKKIDNKYNIIPTKLYSTNMSVDDVNIEELNKLTQDFYEYESTITIKNKKLTESAINMFKRLCPCQELLQLCVDTQVMLIRNLDVPAGLVNGSRGVIIKFINDVPVVRFMNGVEKQISFIGWDFYSGIDLQLTISQIPLRVAYACTHHKTQGMTLDCVELNLSDIFEYGQAYVALSRVKNLDSLVIKSIDYNKIKAHPKALEFYKNI